jgi:ketosteroid isomerase-like protein
MTARGDDPAAVRELIERYAAAADRADGDSVAGLFVADGELVMYLDPTADEPTARRLGRAEIRRAIDRLAAYRATYHCIGGCVVEVDGDRAEGDTRCDAHHLVDEPDAIRDHTMYIRYRDEFRRTGDGWRFVRRELKVLWTSVGAVELVRPTR